jgi:hypothetical protein
VKGVEALNTRCTQIADRVVPEYRVGRKSYSCTGGVAKRWFAAWQGACIAFGYDPREAAAGIALGYDPKEVTAAKKEGKAT